MTKSLATPFDHNIECLYCDEQAGHADDCPVLEYEAVRKALETSEQRARDQFQMLLAIRTMADEATGINRTRGDERDPGALGAVKALVEAYRRLKPR